MSSRDRMYEDGGAELKQARVILAVISDTKELLRAAERRVCVQLFSNNVLNAVQ